MKRDRVRDEESDRDVTLETTLSRKTLVSLSWNMEGTGREQDEKGRHIDKTETNDERHYTHGTEAHNI